MSFLDRFRVDGQRVLLTGSTQGIGLAIAKGLASTGASHVYLNSEADNAAAREAVDAINSLGTGAEVAHLCQDLSVPAGGTSLASALMERAEGYGVDILVLCAGVQIEKPWLQQTSSDFELQIRVNLQSSLEVLQALTPPMAARGAGRVLVISSVQAHSPSLRMLVYAATKAALNNVTKGIARKLARDGVTVNSISPGIINTTRNQKAVLDPEHRQEMESYVPMRRIGEAEDCVGAALLLCSPAGAYITGADILIDGGISL